MKRNVLLIVVLGLALYGVVAGFGYWASSENDVLGYSTERMVEAAYRASARTAYTPPAAGNSAVAVPMSATRGTLFCHTYVPAANYTVSTPMLSGGSYASQGLTLTSQPRQQSYGGGGSAMGASASSRTSSGSGFGGSSYAMGGSVSSGYASSSTYTYSINAGGGIPSNGNMTSTFSPSAVYASAPAPYASFNNDFGASALGGVVSSLNPTSASGTSWLPVRASGRRYAPPTGDNAYLNWLSQFGSGALLYTSEGVAYYDIEKLRQIYEEMYGDGTHMPDISWEDFLKWFTGYDGVAVPLGDGCSPLLFFAVIFICSIAFCQKRKRISIDHEE